MNIIKAPPPPPHTHTQSSTEKVLEAATDRPQRRQARGDHN